MALTDLLLPAGSIGLSVVVLYYTYMSERRGRQEPPLEIERDLGVKLDYADLNNDWHIDVVRTGVERERKSGLQAFLSLRDRYPPGRTHVTATVFFSDEGAWTPEQFLDACRGFGIAGSFDVAGNQQHSSVHFTLETTNPETVVDFLKELSQLSKAEEEDRAMSVDVVESNGSLQIQSSATAANSEDGED